MSVHISLPNKEFVHPQGGKSLTQQRHPLHLKKSCLVLVLPFLLAAGVYLTLVTDTLTVSNFVFLHQGGASLRLAGQLLKRQ